MVLDVTTDLWTLRICSNDCTTTLCASPTTNTQHTGTPDTPATQHMVTPHHQLKGRAYQLRSHLSVSSPHTAPSLLPSTFSLTPSLSCLSTDAFLGKPRPEVSSSPPPPHQPASGDHAVASVAVALVWRVVAPPAPERPESELPI